MSSDHQITRPKPPPDPAYLAGPAFAMAYQHFSKLWNYSWENGEGYHPIR
ncbi:hypothetical protein HBI56_112550 [Parastagonospora nodorum]|uniref:Uncharacterized protein n=1 Tax=Phaeosphaeria nodorum (strain SN15 / ATCC MYA-4574 / FGSC 10173) TaxID=321614 RepID=A0A7U2ETJ5_PHANO|nr:hypothetical protein HBH56_045180 [Parastagonospora nodorum]QRC92709.1 hypothetical protein JI435_428520 [Parastagonospora nodorum SN15]KAH3933280.1 hypothetical protein HBH54_072930 [Parastagonospora nodorum]KAH3946423.1 hypothetical protein HBH53_132090 [Parastagonospora nodorum]KAH3973323.1 hypothetical protein HBH52_144970 [Parastagonospora nodorum]